MNDVTKEIIEHFKSLNLLDANEAETRKKVIDRILEDVLGWIPEDISYEERVSEDGSTTYADYIIRTANTSFLVEAKRVGRTFEIVNNSRRINKLQGSMMTGDLGKDIIQARDYCRKKSIPFAVVTNGNQWIIFPAVRTDQVSFAESKSIVFDSITRTLGEELEYFKSLLSRDGVIDGNLSTELIGRNIDQVEERRLNKFFKGNGHRVQNPIYPLIENEVITAFSDTIVDADADLLDKCYVKNADRKKFDNKIQMHLQKRDQLFSSSPKRPMRKKDSSALSDSINQAIQNVKPLAILILGTVGTGKTTFLEYTRRVAARDFFSKRKDKAYPHWIHIDFRGFSLEENSYDYIYEKLFEYLKDDAFFQDYERSIKHAYKSEISSLKSGPLHLLSKNPEAFEKKITEIILSDYEKVTPYVDKLISYGVKSSPIFMVIDNIDQFESEEDQSKIFQNSIAIAGKLKLNLVIAMRESTYVNHRNSPTFDAFDFDPIHIEPPEIPAVLSRRFFLTHQLLQGKPGSFEALNGAIFDVSDLSVFIDIVKSSVLGTEVGEKIDVLANHDVRLALRMTREFLARGYTDPAKALLTYDQERRYTLPRQEAFRAILLGNQSVYSEEYSVIGNPFDSRLGRVNSELLRLFVLSALVRKSSENGVNYIDGPTIRDNLNSIGFSENDTISVLSDLCDLRFAHTMSHGKADINKSFCASRLGGHLVRRIISEFTFVENVLMDTFISDKEIWNQLKKSTEDISSERSILPRINLRIQRARVFYDYMASQYRPIFEEASKRGLESYWLGNPLIELKQTFENDLSRVLRSAEANYGKGAKKRKRH